MTVAPNANGTARRRSAVLWGVVGALFFLVLHQGYLLLDGTFLGVVPVAAVGVVVFAATTVASYYTAGHLEVFEPGKAPQAEEPEPAESEAAESEPAGSGTAESGPAESGPAESDSEEETDDAEDEWIWGG